MKNKRLYAIVLLAVFALLQIRVAFAACAIEASPAAASAPDCCGQRDPSAGAMQSADDMAALCATARCAELYAAQQGTEPVAPGAPSLPVGEASPPPTFTADTTATSSRLSLAAAHLPHTRLVYVLQRLLI